MLHQTSDCSQQFLSRPSVGVQHLFTDGACTQPAAPDLAAAAWSVVNASSGCVVATGHLPGIYQSAPRAELYGVLSAVSWVRVSVVCGVIWCDSLKSAEGLHLMLQGDAPTPARENFDLWQRIWDQVSELQVGQLRVQHVTSHLDPEQCSDVFEEWVAKWNAHADTVAGTTNVNRTWPFQQVWRRAQQYYDDTAKCLRALRVTYLRIADAAGSGPSDPEVSFEYDAADINDNDLPVGHCRHDTIQEVLPLTWREELLRGTAPHLRRRTEKLVQFLLEQDSNSDLAFSVSWLELIAMLWIWDCSVWGLDNGIDPRLPTPSPTVAEQMRLFRRFTLRFFKQFGVQVSRVYRISGVPWGFGFPLDGVQIGVSTDLLLEGRSLLRSFMSRHFCHTVAALERRFQCTPQGGRTTRTFRWTGRTACAVRLFQSLCA